MRGKYNLILTACISLGLINLLLFTGCAKKNSEGLEKECVVLPGQEDLFSGKWGARPVPLALNISDFNASEQQAITAAITTWNSFMTASKGFAIYTTITPSSGAALSPAAVCNSAMISAAGGFTNTVKIIKMASWPNNDPNWMALTLTCTPAGGGTMAPITNAVMQLNYRDFFVAGKPQPHLQSVILHELGHLLGLMHSCEGDQCQGATSEISKSAMFPNLGFRGITGEVKTAINQNDQGRANCLYE